MTGGLGRLSVRFQSVASVDSIATVRRARNVLGPSIDLHKGFVMRSRLSFSKYAAFCIVMLVLGLGSRTSAAVPYTFTLIADNSGPFSFIAPVPPSINAGGTVAFLSLLDAGGQGIFTGTGVVPNATNTIADTSGRFERFSGPSINAAGTVAFFADLGAGGQGIFTGTGAAPNATATVADTGGPFNRVFVTPPIDANGTVAFVAGFPGGTGIFTGTGAVPNVTTTVADSSGPFSAFSSGVSINAGGTMAFQALLDNGERGVFTSTGAVPNVTTPIVDSTGPLDSFGPSPAINAGGTVLFDALVDGGGVQGLFTGNGAALNVITPIADTTGAFANFASTYAINAAGAVAFFATTDTGNDGIFTGPDAIAHKVIETGDLLFGNPVEFVDIFTEGMNDAGQIAFYFELENGTRGIARADPELVLPPEVPISAASTLPLLGIGLGALAFAARRKIAT